MKKNLLVYLFAACCTGSVFTACSSDDDNAAVVFPIDQEIAGKYKGTLVVQVDGTQLGVLWHSRYRLKRQVTTPLIFP